MKKIDIRFACLDGKIKSISTSHNCEKFVSWEDEILRFGVVVKVSQHVLVVGNLWGNLDMGLPLTLALYLGVFRQWEDWVKMIRVST